MAEDTITIDASWGVTVAGNADTGPLPVAVLLDVGQDGRQLAVIALKAEQAKKLGEWLVEKGDKHKQGETK